MKKKIFIKVRTDFSRTPGPRFPEEGKFSGQDFRQKILLPALKEAKKAETKVVVDLDNTKGYGTSFLEEVFGGLIRHDGFTKKELDELLELISIEEEEYIQEIKHYIQVAEEKEAIKRK